ncbi:hypothetical protein SSCG_02099 [Streptomyces clavuligerus]|nr:hypothetical protein SSCG_02099 [Streptomyces clavuligerus]
MREPVTPVSGTRPARPEDHTIGSPGEWVCGTGRRAWDTQVAG